MNPMMSEINLLITRVSAARHFPLDNKLVEADFSIWRDYGPRKAHSANAIIVPGILESPGSGKYEGLL